MRALLFTAIWAAPWLFSPAVHALDRPEVQQSLPYSDFVRYDRKLTRAEIEAKIARYLQKTPDSDLQQYYSVTDRELSMYESPEKKAQGIPEFTLKLRSGDPRDKAISSALGNWKPSKDARKPLDGLRVALDPGHFGGEIAGYRLPEDRYVWMRDSGAQFNEGTLAFLTARRMQELLEADGAKVLLTREAIGEGAEGIPYAYWFGAYFQADLEEYLLTNFKTDADRERARASILDPNNPTGPYRVLNWRDLRLRAQKINAFGPHLSIVMHFNAGGPGKDAEGRDGGTEENLLMAFVPGSFMNGELADQVSRYHFVRLAVTDDIRESQAFSREVLAQLAAGLRVNVVPPDYPASYLVNGSLYLEPGVYARNLGMSRLTKGRICYAEPLFQENFDESLRLAKKDAVIDGVPTSSRLLEVADAYYRSILGMAKQARLK